ncbi:MAG: sodium/proton-translocating pyrophosphatase, partial [Bacteroidia bacterium]|nr:sodium/proton-translocating pyrophosphatase [Bacteroidia bacterium]
MEYLMYVVPAIGVVGLLFAWMRARWVSLQPDGDERMRQIARYIARGAMSFLRAEYRVLAIYALVAAVFLGFLSWNDAGSSPLIIVSFLLGATFSALAGWAGMTIATKANVRTAEAAKTSLSKALNVSFGGGTVMGFVVVGLAILGVGGLFVVFNHLFNAENTLGAGLKRALSVLVGFSFGAESIALFARVGGGIYTKAADVG